MPDRVWFEILVFSDFAYYLDFITESLYLHSLDYDFSLCGMCVGV